MAFRSSTNITPGNGTSFAISVPTGAASGDIAVVTMYCEVEDTITAPSGFTQKSDPRAGTAATTGRLIVFWKRLTAADTGTYTFSWTNTSWRDASCALFSGRSTSGDPFEASNTGVSSGNTATVTAITATANADLYGGTICYNTGDLTPPAGTTERYDGNTHAMVTQDALSAGSTGSLAFAWTNGITTAFIGSLHIAGGGGSSLTASPSDNLGLTDSLSVAWDRARTPADSLGATDSLSTTQTGSFSPNDPLGMTDSLSVTNAAVRGPADPLGMTDAMSVVWDRVATISDPVGITDPGQASDIGTNVADPLGITDSLSVAQSGGVLVADSLGLTDSLAVTWDRVATLADGLGMSDANTKGGDLSATLADALGMTDSLSAVFEVPPATTTSWVFNPPTRPVLVGTDSLWGRITIRVGRAVLKMTDGSFRTVDTYDPNLPDVEKVYLGGYVHTLDTEAAELLTQAGYGDYLTEVTS